MKNKLSFLGWAVAFLLVIAVATMLVPGLRAQAGAGAAGKAEQDLMQAEKDRFAAMITYNEAALNKLLGDDLTYTHSNANLQTKTQFVADLKKGDIDYVSIQPSPADWKARVVGTMAIVNGVAAVNVIDHGNNLKFKIRYTSAYVNHNGSWQMVNWQSTRFPQ